MFFALFLVIAIILIMITMITFIMRLGYVAAVVVDVLIIGGFSIYYAHHQWFVHIASGNAVYFWDLILFIVIFVLYSTILVIGTNKFPRIAAIFHYIIAWFATLFIYVFINLVMFNGMGSLLNHSTMNEVVHFIIISLLAFIIFNARMRIFKTVR